MANKFLEKISPFFLVGIDENKAKETIGLFTGPFYNILIWAVPIIGAIAAGVVGIHYLMMDPQEREHNSNGFVKQLKTILIITIIIEAIVIIFSIFGIEVSV